MKILAIASQKGGVGKTTTAVTLAHGLSLKGYEVLLVDLDPQGHCASALGRDHEPGVFNLLVSDHSLGDVIRTTGRLRLSLLPGDKRTATAQVVLLAEGRLSPDLLARILRPVTHNGFDFCIIDTAPAVGGLQETALYAAELLIIPCALDYLSSEAVAATLSTLKAINARGGKCQLMGVLPTFFDTTRESRETLDDLVDAFGASAVLEPIHRAVVLRECSAEGKTIYEHAPASRAAEEYAALVWKVKDYAKTTTR